MQNAWLGYFLETRWQILLANQSYFAQPADGDQKSYALCRILTEDVCRNFSLSFTALNSRVSII